MKKAFVKVTAIVMLVVVALSAFVACKKTEDKKDTTEAPKTEEAKPQE